MWFQRFSVICTELLLLWAINRYVESAGVGKTQRNVIFALVAFNGGLILVDHIHFQYNGMLLGLLVLCVDFANRVRW